MASCVSASLSAACLNGVFLGGFAPVDALKTSRGATYSSNSEHNVDSSTRHCLYTERNEAASTTSLCASMLRFNSERGVLV